ncbi:hypothetical protein [uncultured Algibacter sp.]|uniref:hypothetical protein n=1 Tax=uncultured Algibacter sp. TaxID=298659 RepID=UPI002613EFBE|nr:hypothetical protein [uncultured Algibacter sp.]
MNFLYKYYASILGLIRFIGIGVGNEDARASAVFTVTFCSIFSIITKSIGYSIKSFGTLLLVFLVLSIFFFSYYFFTNKRNKQKINNWLKLSYKKEKITVGLVSLVAFITSIIISLKTYG